MSGGGVAGILLILLLVVALFIAASCVKIVPQASAYAVSYTHLTLPTIA